MNKKMIFCSFFFATMQINLLDASQLPDMGQYTRRIRRTGSRNPQQISDLHRPLIDLNEVSATLRAHADDLQFLASLGNNPEYVAQLLASIQQTPSMADEGMSCLKVLEGATTSVMGFAPMPIQIAFQCLKYATKGLPALISKTQAHLRDLKGGIWTNADGNNILHLAVQNRMRKLAAYCIANCQASVFSQPNKQGFTPRQFAAFHKSLTESQRTQHLSEVSELESRIAKRNEQRTLENKKEKVRLSDSLHLTTLNNKIAKADKTISHIDAIIAMLDVAAPFYSFNEACAANEGNENDPEIIEIPVVDFTNTTTLETLQAAIMKLKTDLFNLGSMHAPLQFEDRQECIAMFDLLLEFGCLTPRLYALIRPAERMLV
jgi:hypothetical protein